MAPVPPSQPSAQPLWVRLWHAVPRAAVGNLAAKLAMVSLGLAITVLVARQGPAVQGAFALFVACESALLTLFSGLGLWLARQVSQQQGDEARALWPRLRQVLRAGVVLGLMASVALAALAWHFDRPPFSLLWVLALAAPFLLLVPTATGLWLGQGRMWPLNLAQVAAPGAVLTGLGLLFFLRDENRPLAPTVLLVLMAWVTGKSLVAVVTAWRARGDALAHDEALGAAASVQRLSGATGSWVQDWRFVAVIGLTNVVSLMNFRISLFLVERFRGLAEAGTYSVAVTVAELLWLLSSSVTVAVYARIGHPDRDAAAATTVQAVRINLLVTALAAPVLLLGAHWALPWALGAPYEASVLPLALLLPGVAAYAAASSLSAFYTNHLGRPHLSGLVASFSLAISAGLGFVLVPALGAAGAAAATSLGYGLAIVLALALFLRLSGLPGSVLWRGVPPPRA